MLVAWQALVSTSPNVGAPLESVVVNDLGPIRHTLILQFLFVQRAVALEAHLKSTGTVNVQLGKAKGIRPARVVDSRDAYLSGKWRCLIRGRHEDSVSRDAKSKVCE